MTGRRSNETTPLVRPATTVLSVDGSTVEDANPEDTTTSRNGVVAGFVSSSLPSGSSDGEEGEPNRPPMTASIRKLRNHTLGWILLMVLMALPLSCVIWRMDRPEPVGRLHKGNNNNSNNNNHSTLLPMMMPAGVNFGSWLSLEDYFFASDAALEVATPWNHSQAQCLPPLVTAHSWQSETDLLQSLANNNNNNKNSLVPALQALHAHRLTFIDLERDLAYLQRLGVQHVRVPLSWCLTHFDIQDMTETNVQHYVCRDPFISDAVWPAVPRSLIQDLLRTSARFQIQVTLDVHTYPGATSLGTFSGLWPRWPQFWRHDDPQKASADVGRRLWREFIEWLEELMDTDPLAFQGLHAVSPMNEPAHLAGLYDYATDPESAFLPPLPPALAQQFALELQPPSSTTTTTTTTVPDGPHLRVMLWLRDAVVTFRSSRLVAHGKHIHVNIHESVLSSKVTQEVMDLDNNDDDTESAALRIMAAFWRGITTPTERATWAVLDVHHYHAWAKSCQGSVIPGEGNYTCGSGPETLQRCTAWAETFRRIVTEECDGDTTVQLVSAEFSVATHHQVRHACNDLTTLRAWYVAQLEAARKANIDLYYWSYHMPYGGAFRNAWSFRHLMYLLQPNGAEFPPDEPQFVCGNVESSLLGEVPTDDTFSL